MSHFEGNFQAINVRDSDEFDVLDEFNVMEEISPVFDMPWDWAGTTGTSTRPSGTPPRGMAKQSELSRQYSPLQTISAAPAPAYDVDGAEALSDDEHIQQIHELFVEPEMHAEPSGPEMSPGSQYPPSPTPRISEVTEENPTDASAIDPECIRQSGGRHPFVYCSGRLSDEESDDSPRVLEKHVFNFGDSARRSVVKKETPMPPIQSRPRPSVKETLTRPANPAIAFPTLETVLNPIDKNADMNTFFTCIEEANAIESPDEEPDDPTLPQTVDQKRAMVKALFNAMSSTERAQDNPGMIKPFAEGKYPDVRIEVVAWNILEATVGRHRTGPLMADFMPNPKQTGEFYTFGDRLCSILDCLATQKTICKHLLDPFYLYAFVNDPIGARKRVLANKNLNKRKGMVMNAGKQALGGSSSPTVDNDQLDDPFGSTASGFTSEANSAMTPDNGRNRRAMKALNLGNYPQESSPMMSSQSMQSSPPGSVSGKSSYDASPDLRGISHHHSPPIASYSPMAFLPHLLARNHPRTVPARESAPMFTPPRTSAGMSSMQAHTVHSRVGANSSGSPSSNTLTPGSATNTFMPPQTPTRRPRGGGSQTPSTGRKRTSAAMGAVEYRTHEKRRSF